jgi:hypothetical protein
MGITDTSHQYNNKQNTEFRPEHKVHFPAAYIVIKNVRAAATLLAFYK